MREFQIKKDLHEWGCNIRGDILGGMVSAFSVIPEVIGFTIVAGVDPVLGLMTSVVFLIVLSFLGGRPAMVSAGAGSMAVVVVSLIRNFGTQYLFAAVILAGFIQLILSLCRVDRLMKYVSAPVVTGFVDALAIIICKAQITSLLQNMGDTTSGSIKTVLLVIIGLSAIILFPRITKAVPSTLISIIVVTGVSLLFLLITGSNQDITMIADMGDLHFRWNGLHIPNVPMSFETLRIVFPYGISLAFVGLLETMMTNQVVDKMTGTTGNKKRECCAQGLGNLLCGLFGAMPGCAMIGQAIANVESGGRGRLSTLVSGILLLCLLIFGSAILGKIPLAALISVMLFVSWSTFDWKNLKKLITSRDRITMRDGFVTLITVVVTVSTDNLAYGVGAGLVAATVLGKILRPKET